MNILKYYSIIVIGIAALLNLVLIVKENDKNKRESSFVAALLEIPVLIYLILN